MTRTEFQLQAIGDPRLAPYATSVQPTWLWSTDGHHVLWANPAGAVAFGVANAAEFATKTFGPADSHRRQITQLAGLLPLNGSTRLERLRGFGARPGMLMTCGCARLGFPDGSHGILIHAVETTARVMALEERLRRLVEGQDAAVAAFDRNGVLLDASEAARPLVGFRNLTDAGWEAARDDALTQGRAEIEIESGQMVLQRVGSGADIGLVATIVPRAVDTAPEPALEVSPTLPLYEQPALSNEAPAEFALIDEFSEPLDGEPPAPAHTETMTEEPPAKPSPDAEAFADQQPPSEQPAPVPRRHPLRFTWQMDASGRFSLGSDEFAWLIGARTASGFGRPWAEIAEIFGLDPAGRVLEAIATRETWSGITLYWPVDGGGRLPVELSGLPIYDENRAFAGYRGFGVCRDLDSLDHLAEQRRHEPLGAMSEPDVLSLGTDIVPADSQHVGAADPPVNAIVMPSDPPGPPASIANENSPPTDLDEPVETPQNVVLFRPIGEARSPALSPVENHAFNELARQLSARLDREPPALPEAAVTSEVTEPPREPALSEPPREQPPTPEWLAPPEPPARGEMKRDRRLLDLLPTGVLIYRLDRLLYANPAFLQRMGYDSLHALEQAGGVDALYVEAGVSQASSTSEAGTPVTIAANEDAPATHGRLFTVSWDDESALALMFSPTQGVPEPTPPALPTPAPEPVVSAPLPPAVGHAEAEDLAAILDTTAEGIVMFDAEGNIQACNRSAEALFGYDGEAFLRRNLTDLFAPESARSVAEYLESVKGAGVASLLDHGREVLGRVARGGIIPLAMTMGRTRLEGPNFFAVFRDLSQSKKGESELQQARRLTERAASAKADMLARISHEVRTPLNAIIGFAEVMMAERFGALGNERYGEYMKDIRASGERVIAIINDLTELSRIETGKLDLAFTNQNLNEMVESCVAVMQPQANRERIIIRTSLAQALPPVVADGRALRQITMNLIGNSIHLANPAGQVIVSTALSDFGEVVLRVRDTGPGLNDNELAAALEPFRTPPPSDQASEHSPVSLSLTKALVEANRAQFNLKTTANSGTLVEVVFSRAMARS
ncbi:MAG TPA: PAS domain-containing protein [Bradyrhizobium sp.]|uniref:PAS domain-containing protein n=1 Tax=Bradyrhizobium sp. TaxID=376 RepID=UPI002CAD6589|nr:PAS domain-containing protein [Bradyrhizobium sp.]HLZ02812.1 PAS domain-containing protein [Bradyrhizobium sp.]